jgi:hypothetical protein
MLLLIFDSLAGPKTAIISESRALILGCLSGVLGSIGDVREHLQIVLHELGPLPGASRGLTSWAAA